MSDLQTDDLSPNDQAPNHQARCRQADKAATTDTSMTTDRSIQYEALVQTLDEYATLLNCLLSALNEARSASDQT